MLPESFNNRALVSPFRPKSSFFVSIEFFSLASPRSDDGSWNHRSIGANRTAVVNIEQASHYIYIYIYIYI